MDSLRSIDSDEHPGGDYPADDEPRPEMPPVIGTDERRMHVRAYNYWVSLLHGRHYPSIQDLDPAGIAGFGPNSVLLDFTAGPENPAVPFLGSALREEGAIDNVVARLDDVPSGSLIARLTDHYLQIIANRAPIGFEAEYLNRRGGTTLYRGILMPFSSDGETIDFIYGVINWKDVADPALANGLAAEIGRALRDPPPPSGPVWADGPNALDAAREDADPALAADEDESPPLGPDAGLGDRLAAAREIAEAARSADRRSRGALYRALGLAYDFALAAEVLAGDYAELLADAGLKAQARAPMTPIVKLVFGAEYDKTRLTEFAAALARGRRLGIGAGDLRGFIEGHPGGLKGVVAAERRDRRPPARPDAGDQARAALRAAPPRAVVDMDGLDGADAEFLLLVARREADGSLALLAPLCDPAMVERALRRVAPRQAGS